jgi:glycosyltransferase involved in cell wall biosynthesis
METQNTQKILLITLDEVTGSILFLKALELFSQYFDQVHIVIFSKKLFFKPKDIRHPNPKTYIYNVSNFPLARRICFSNLIDVHLSWQGHFHPTQILAFGTGFPTHRAMLWAKKYTVPITMKISANDTVATGAALVLSENAFIYRDATHLIVEGGEKIKKLAPYASKITQMTPFFDFESMTQSFTEPILFNRKYNKDFFLITHIETLDKKAIEVIFDIMEKIKDRYKNGGWIIFVPYRDMKAIKALIPHSLRSVIFVEPAHADMAPLYKGARLYISTLSYDEFSIPVLSALNLGIPVITTPTGYIKDIYTGTAYEQYVVSQNDIDGFCEKIIYLMEKDFATNDYKMNTPTIIRNFPRVTAEDYYKKIAEVVLQ